MMHSELLNEIVGKKGTPDRGEFEDELSADVLAYKIKKLRKEKHLTQTQLAEKLEVDKTQISKIENGKLNMTIQSINRVLRALDARIKFDIQPL